MVDRTRPLSRIGEWRAISGMGILYVALAVGWGGVQFGRGLSPRTVAVLGFMIVTPGSMLAYGGEIRIDSDPDEGTAFSFTLPAADSAANRVRAGEPAGDHDE